MRLKRSAAAASPGLTSGWCFFAKERYAFFHVLRRRVSTQAERLEGVAVAHGVAPVRRGVVCGRRKKFVDAAPRCLGRMSHAASLVLTRRQAPAGTITSCRHDLFSSSSPSR